MRSIHRALAFSVISLASAFAVTHCGRDEQNEREGDAQQQDDLAAVQGLDLSGATLARCVKYLRLSTADIRANLDFTHPGRLTAPLDQLCTALDGLGPEVTASQL